MKTLHHQSFSAILVLVTLAQVPSGTAGAIPLSLKVISERPIPSPQWRSPEGLQPILRKIAPAAGATWLERPEDIRWDDDGHVLVAAGRDGTFRLPITESDRSPLERVYAPLPDMGFLDAQVLLGASREFLVTAAPYHLMSWIPRTVPDPKPISIELNFNTLLALDVSGDRLLVLGLQKLEKSQLAADGAIAWTARLGKKLTQVRPVQFSVSGPGAHDVDACAEMRMGKVRFLPDGSFVVVPGGEAGIFLHDAAGKLIKTWQAEKVGFDAGCQITEKEMYRYSADIPARFQWLNRHRILDEILPLPTGIGFVVRTRAYGLTVWQLKVLAPDGTLAAYDVPVTSSSPYARLTGDVRGDRIAFLLALESADVHPAGSQHLIIVQVPHPSGALRPAGKPSAPKKTSPPAKEVLQP